MKELLEQVKEELERAYSNPESHDLSECIQQLEEAKQQYGDKGTMLSDLIRALEQAGNSEKALENAGDISSSASFGQAYNGLVHAIESYQD